jgi:hypothetical protein
MDVNINPVHTKKKIRTFVFMIPHEEEEENIHMNIIRN